MKACPNCGDNSWQPFLGMTRKLQCRGCKNVVPRKDLVAKEETRRSQSRGRAKKRIRRSAKNEIRRAAEIGGGTTPGSGNRGALSISADVFVKDTLREEDKETEAKSYTLRLADLLKVARQAAANGEIPALRVQFLRERQRHAYVVLREEDFDQLLVLLRREVEDSHSG